jgi:predicted dehydrogenase
MKKINIGIIGTGKIAQEYIHIFKKLNLNIQIICARKKKKLEEFSKKNNVNKFTTNINNFLKEKLDGVIVCVSPESTFLVAKKLLNFSGKILFEKPVGLNLNQTNQINEMFKNKKNLFVALNRRFYKSTMLAKNYLQNSKEKKIITIYDQENTFSAKRNGHHKLTIKNWMYANSVHLVDLIKFFINSKIVKINKNNIKSKNSLIYNSIINFSNGDIVEFKSFWNRPAPWKINISTDTMFIELMPIENIRFIPIKKKFDFADLKSNKKDQNFKPGFLLQSEHFVKELKNKKNNLVKLSEYNQTVLLINKIFFH